MDAANKKKTKDRNLNNILDAFCQEFDGVSFYGLEYIVEELFQKKKKNPPTNSHSSEDWYDLYD